MIATLYPSKGNREPVDLVIPPDWNLFWLLTLASIACLILAALLAKVNIRNLPANPLYWHYWVVSNASPVSSGIFLFFWSASIICLMMTLPVLVAILGDDI